MNRPPYDPSLFPPTLATLSGGAFGDALAPGGPAPAPPASAPRDQFAELMAMPLAPPGVLMMDPNLQRLFQLTTPLEKKFALTWNFDEGVITSDVLPRVVKLNTFPFLCTGYRWEWSGRRLSPTFTPIRIQYGTTNDETIGRDDSDNLEGAFITAVFGSPSDWVYLARPKLYRKLRFLNFKAKLDWSLIGEDEPPASVLELVMDGLECRPIGSLGAAR